MKKSNRATAANLVLSICATLFLSACSNSPASGTQAEEPSAMITQLEFVARSRDGIDIHGQIDRPANATSETPIIVMAAGTGLFDRDVAFGKSGTDDDKLFLSLAKRFNLAGISTARYDRRGVRFKPIGGEKLDRATASTATTETMREDLRAVYDVARAEAGGPDACVVLFGHSEGLLHIARLAGFGAHQPALVVAIGGPLQSPAAILKWQSTERDAFSLRMMDANQDGDVTNEEVKANWRKTPSAVFNVEEPFLHPTGAWSREAIEGVVTAQTTMYEAGKTAALEIAKDEPYPNADTPMASYSWWQSWYADEVSAAESLSNWEIPILLFYGTLDSQVRHEFQLPELTAHISDRAKTVVIKDVGHSLGADVLQGPMEADAENRLITDVTAAVSSACKWKPTAHD